MQQANMICGAVDSDYWSGFVRNTLILPTLPSACGPVFLTVFFYFFQDLLLFFSVAPIPCLKWSKKEVVAILNLFT
jgi:hypothetical protein